MANKGLNSYTKQITQSIGDKIVANVNPCENDANLITTISLFQTIGKIPISFNLYYNNQIKNVNYGMGYGIRTTFYGLLHEYPDAIDVECADGSRIHFPKTGYDYFFNEALQTEIEKSLNSSTDGDTYSYTIKDKYGNITEYDNDTADYPDRIKYNNGDVITLEYNQITIGQNEVISFTRNGGMVNAIEYKLNNVVLNRINITYTSSNFINNIKYYQKNASNQMELIKELCFSFSSTSITLLDLTATTANKYALSNNKVTNIRAGYNITSLIAPDNSYKTILNLAYNSSYTVVTDKFSKQTTYHFDDGGFLVAEFDSYNHVNAYNYSSKLNYLICQSGGLEKQKITARSLLSTITPINYTKYGVTVTSITRPSKLIQNLTGSTTGQEFHITGYGSATYTKRVGGLPTDCLTLLFFAKATETLTSNKKLRVYLKTDSNEIAGLEINSSNYSGGYNYYAVHLVTEKMFNSLTIQLELYDISLDISNIFVINDILGAFYKYDQYNNLIETVTNGGKNDATYGVDSQIKSNKSIFNQFSDYQYDARCNLTHVKTIYGNTVTNTYDNNNNLTASVVKNINDSTITSSNMTYDANCNLTSETNSLGTNNYSYDMYARMTSWVNAINTYTGYQYFVDNALKILKINSSTLATYAYNSDETLQSITIANGTVYSFTYEATTKALKSVTANGVKLYELEYDTLDRLSAIKYGNTAEKFIFTYEDNLLKYIDYNTIGNHKYAYSYDIYGNVITCQNYAINTIVNFDYNDKGQLIKFYYSGLSIDYIYDNLGNIVREKIKGFSNPKIQEFDSLGRSICANPETLYHSYSQENDYFTCFFEDGYKLKSANEEQTFQYKAVDAGGIELNGLIYQASLNSTNYLQIGLDAQTTYSGSIAYWFKSSGTLANKVLFSTNSCDEGASIKVYLDSSKRVIVKIYRYSDGEFVGEETLLTTNNSVNTSNWNFFGFSWNNKEILVMLNGIVTKTTIQYEFYLEYQPLYMIGFEYSGGRQNILTCKFTALLVGKGKSISFTELNEYYNNTKEFLIDKGQNINDVDISMSNCLNFTSNDLDMFEIYPLHNSILSLSGSRLDTFKMGKTLKYDKDGLFVYNKGVNRYVFKANGSYISNEFRGEEATIALRACITAKVPTKQYIVEFEDVDGLLLGLFINEQGYLACDVNGTIYTTSFLMSINVWHNIALSFSNSIPYTDSTGTKYPLYIRILFDNLEYTVIDSNYFDLFFFVIGKSCKFNTFFGEENHYALYGLIEMVCTRHAYCEKSTLTSLFSRMESCVSKTTYYNSLGQPINRIIGEGERMCLNQTYTYNTTNKTLISAENINSIYSRNYEYNNVGYVTKITDTAFGSHTYTYDAKGRITADNAKTYEYDANGNIIRAGDVIFEYDSTYKDKLIRVGGNPVNYNSNNPLNPTSYAGQTYTYEGRRLTSYYEDENTWYYTYDADGNRIKKTWDNRITRYLYSGNRLVSENDGTNKLDYLYDENGALYGFILNNTTKYFYIRDILQTILGIVDINGAIMVKYNYDAFGNCTILKDTNNLATINPFRYKGYYYDIESGMYYCHSRYYVPEWGRWLNADSYTFLEPTNIHGLNLFSYCGNNPVMGMDPNGNFAILLGAILIGVSFGVGFGASALSQGVKYGFDNINYWQSITDGLFAGVSTAISFTGIGMLASIGLGAAMGFGQYAADSAFHNEELSIIGTVSSVILGGIGGAISGAGTRNATNIAREMKLTGNGATAISAITNAANKRAAGIISEKGMQGVLNLYSRTAYNAVNAAITETIRSLMIKSSFKIMASTAFSAAINIVLSHF